MAPKPSTTNQQPGPSPIQSPIAGSTASKSASKSTPTDSPGPSPPRRSPRQRKDKDGNVIPPTPPSTDKQTTSSNNTHPLATMVNKYAPEFTIQDLNNTTPTNKTNRVSLSNALDNSAKNTTTQTVDKDDEKIRFPKTLEGPLESYFKIIEKTKNSPIYCVTKFCYDIAELSDKELDDYIKLLAPEKFKQKELSALKREIQKPFFMNKYRWPHRINGETIDGLKQLIAEVSEYRKYSSTKENKKSNKKQKPAERAAAQKQARELLGNKKK
jgi:hypothetical protein